MSPEWRIGDYIYSTTKENLTTILTGKIKFNKPVNPQEKKSQNRKDPIFFFKEKRNKLHFPRSFEQKLYSVAKNPLHLNYRTKYIILLPY